MTDERTSIEVIAPTIDEAVGRGLVDLGLSREAVDVEVLDGGGQAEPGLGQRQARVRLVARPAGAPPETETERLARETLTEILSRMKIRARVSYRWDEPDEPGEAPPLILDVRGDDLGVLIGRRGETLDALQYITRLIVSKQANAGVNLLIDVEGYRARRAQQLRQLAQRMAEQAVQRGRTVALEPMPPSERRLVHLALRDHPSVVTESVGEGSARKVTIIPKAQ